MIQRLDHAKSFFKCISIVSDRCVLEILENVLSVSANDPAEVLLVKAFMHGKTDMPAAKIGLDVSDLNPILEEIRSSTIDFGIEKILGNTIFTVTHGSTSSYQFKEYIKCYNPESIKEAVPRPNFGMTFTAPIKTSTFKQMLDLASQSSDCIRLEPMSTEDQTFLCAYAGEKGSDMIATTATVNVTKMHGLRGWANSTFSIEYLRDITEATPVDYLELGLGINTPCYIKFGIAGGTVEYVLCQRAPSD